MVHCKITKYYLGSCVSLTLLTNIDEQAHQCPISIRYLTMKPSCYYTIWPTVECNKSTASISVVSTTKDHRRHLSAIRKIELPSTHFGKSISAASGVVSGTLQGSRVLSDVSPQHSRAIGVGYTIEDKSKTWTGRIKTRPVVQ